MDSSMVPADVSNNSVVNKESLRRYLNKSYQILKKRKYFKKRKHYEYIDSADTCNSCRLKEKCTKA
ncbi:hypothetical protein ACFL0M_14355 [Thermodesulfobacteriota bacterium]